MRIKCFGMLLLAAVLVSTTGCHYVSRRGHDFADMFKLSGGLHLGVSASARAFIFGYGAGAAQSYRVGIEKKGIFGQWEEFEVGFPAINAWGIYDLADGMYRNGESLERALGALYNQAFEEGFAGPRREVYIPIIAMPLSYEESAEGGIKEKHRFAEYCWVEGGGGALLSVRAGFNPLEFIDFLAGWTTLDIIGDDDRVKDKPRQGKTDLDFE